MPFDAFWSGVNYEFEYLTLRRKPDDFQKVIRFFCVYKSLSTLP